VLNVFVSKIRLQRPGIVTPVGQRIAAGVPEHVRTWLEAGSQWTRVSEQLLAVTC